MKSTSLDIEYWAIVDLFEIIAQTSLLSGELYRFSVRWAVRRNIDSGLIDILRQPRIGIVDKSSRIISLFFFNLTPTERRFFVASLAAKLSEECSKKELLDLIEQFSSRSREDDADIRQRVINQILKI